MRTRIGRLGDKLTTYSSARFRTQIAVRPWQKERLNLVVISNCSVWKWGRTLQGGNFVYRSTKPYEKCSGNTLNFAMLSATGVTFQWELGMRLALLQVKLKSMRWRTNGVPKRKGHEEDSQSGLLSLPEVPGDRQKREKPLQAKVS